MGLSKLKPDVSKEVLGDHLQALLHKVLLDHAEDLVLLEGFKADVPGEVLAVNHALDDVEPIGRHHVAGVRDEHAAQAGARPPPLRPRTPPAPACALNAPPPPSWGFRGDPHTRKWLHPGTPSIRKRPRDS